jgi:hypothetical protein
MRVGSHTESRWRIDYRREFQPKAYFAWGCFAEFFYSDFHAISLVRLTKAAAARPAEPGGAQSRRVAAKVVRRKTAKASAAHSTLLSLAPGTGIAPEGDQSAGYADGADALDVVGSACAIAASVLGCLRGWLPSQWSTPHGVDSAPSASSVPPG